ncbi:MAG: YggS family pyridoxal phosphate-dependent enzyme [Acidobacteriia bacterium]|nr:YggS family pyridoxal phosphate-dependent enzyme [Terriglobia bacterium]
MSIAENIAQVRERMARAARRAGRDPNQITLMAVSKTVEPARIREAYAAGVRVFGENRVQEFAEKAALRDLSGAEWHLIGHLQTNKANKAAEIFSAVDSVDSVKLARKLDAAAEKDVPVLIEINIGGEEAKSGVRADSSELEELLRAAAEFERLEIRGLMTIPPFTEDPEEARPYFRRLRQLRDEIFGRKLPRVLMDVLSMGMSHDFEVAIEEGSTCVRVGTAIFGERQKP